MGYTPAMTHLLLALALTACTPNGEETTPGAASEVLDGETCVPEACATGTWGAVEGNADTVYVDGTADPGGDGSARQTGSACT